MDFGHGRSRPDGIDADAFGRHLARQAVGQCVYAAFGGGIEDVFGGAAKDGEQDRVDPRAVGADELEKTRVAMKKKIVDKLSVMGNKEASDYLMELLK